MIPRLVAGTLGLIGLATVLPVSVAELSSGAACPHLGPLPACHILSLAYGTLVLSVLSKSTWSRWAFLVAWLVIFAFAATGSVMEVFGREICPRTAGGVPKCYFSLALAVALIVAFRFQGSVQESNRNGHLPGS